MNTGKYLIIILLYSSLLQGCLGTKYLKEDEKLLYRQRIKGTENIDKDALEELYIKRPNRKFSRLPFAPYVWIYKKGEEEYDVALLTKEKEKIIAHYDRKIEAHQDEPKKRNRLKKRKGKKIAKIDQDITDGNLLMRWGEPLAVYDTIATQKTLDNFKLYLTSKGYFRSKVTHKEIIKGKKKNKIIEVYCVYEGEPHVIKKLMIDAEDRDILKLMIKNKKASLLRKRENYDQKKLSAERERLELLLKDNGYYDFSRAYISFDVDTAYEDRKVAIRTNIRQAERGKNHTAFNIDRVNFITNVKDMSLPDSLLQEEKYNGIHYRYSAKRYNKKILDRRVFIHPKKLYSKTNTFSTQRQLANLDMFKFVNINYDSSGGRFIANIFTSPLDRYQWSNEVGINVTEGLPGPFYNTTFKKRNFFGGFEVFEVSGRIGFEGVAALSDEDNLYASIEAGANSSLTFPQFILPFSERFKSRIGSINPKTKLQVGYTFNQRPEYERSNINISNTYTWEDRRKAQYNFTLTDASIIDSDLRADFLERLLEQERRGNNLINSFRSSFVSSMSFAATFSSNQYGSARNKSSFLRLFFESGGTSLNFVGTKILDSLELIHYRYLKFSVDFRKNRPITKNSSIAYRVQLGLARPYGTEEVLPYEKYFFIGGSNSVRAWRPRRLGPGSYKPLEPDSPPDYSFEQPGEILLEASIELRKNLFGFVDWAYFIDAGNIWTFNNDNRQGGQFQWDRFSNEIAVATGLGLRFDFSFLILRLDAGLKIYDPARPLGKRLIFNKRFNDFPFDNNNDTEPIVFNLGVGYPF